MYFADLQGSKIYDYKLKDQLKLSSKLSLKSLGRELLCARGIGAVAQRGACDFAHLPETLHRTQGSFVCLPFGVPWSTRNISYCCCLFTDASLVSFA